MIFALYLRLDWLPINKFVVFENLLKKLEKFVPKSCLNLLTLLIHFESDNFRESQKHCILNFRVLKFYLYTR